MIVDLTNMNIAFNGQPFVELTTGGVNLLTMDVAYNGQPFVRQSGFTSLTRVLFLSGSSTGSKLLLLGSGTTKKLLLK